jgi:hypothetical protein
MADAPKRDEHGKFSKAESRRRRNAVEATPEELKARGERAERLRQGRVGRAKTRGEKVRTEAAASNKGAVSAPPDHAIRFLNDQGYEFYKHYPEGAVFARSDYDWVSVRPDGGLEHYGPEHPEFNKDAAATVSKWEALNKQRVMRTATVAQSKPSDFPVAEVPGSVPKYMQKPKKEFQSSGASWKEQLKERRSSFLQPGTLELKNTAERKKMARDLNATRKLAVSEGYNNWESAHVASGPHEVVPFSQGSEHSFYSWWKDPNQGPNYSITPAARVVRNKAAKKLEYYFAPPQDTTRSVKWEPVPSLAKLHQRMKSGQDSFVLGLGGTPGGHGGFGR